MKEREREREITYRNHSGLLLHSINILDNPGPHQILPLEVVELSLLQHLDVPRLHQQLAVLDDEQGAADAAGVRVDADLAVTNVADHRDFSVDDVHLTTQFSKIECINFIN